MKNFNEDKIDTYLKGKMSEAERQDFEQEMNNQEELFSTVETQRSALEYIDVLGDRELKGKLQQIHQRVIKPEEKIIAKKNMWRNISLIAASIALLLGTYWFFLKPPTSAQLFSIHYEPYDLSFTTRDLDATGDLTKIHRLYNNEEFEALIPLIESRLSSEEDAKVRLALGIAYLNQGKANEAIEVLQILLKEKDPLFEEQAIWYTALAYLKLEEFSACTKHLKSLPNSSPFYKNGLQIIQEISKK